MPFLTRLHMIQIYFLYFVIDFLTGNNRDFILFCHTMAEKLTNVKNGILLYYFVVFHFAEKLRKI